MIDTILCGDCKTCIPKLNDSSIASVITSPPYAEQRKSLYNSISEEDYPQWVCDWMEPLKTKLKENASVLIIIRPNIRNGEISDYVLKTRLKLRESGWIECEELIWHKPDAPPLGSTKRPRRTWESILWFSKSRSPFIDLYACGNTKSVRTGGFAGSERFGAGTVTAKSQNRNLSCGTSRCTDIFKASIGSMEKGIMHPAMYPTILTDQLVQSFTQEGDLVLDPFMGSGQTAISAKKLNRHFVGFDISEEYVLLAQDRIKKLANPT
jgi:site-specific DNA-methyltransferase (adenine-specific)/site-specific DNA-methyltransferase (cytosine-N4-specific)